MDTLLIIDMQVKGFENSKQYDDTNTINRINLLSEKFRDRNGSVIFIQHDGTAEQGYEPNSPGWEILPSLIKLDTDTVINKTICDSFYKTTLQEVLTTTNSNRLYITGSASDFCVDTTIRSAVSKDHNVIVVSDCHTTKDRPHLNAKSIIEHHNYVWNDLITAQGSIKVMNLESVLQSFVETAA